MKALLLILIVSFSNEIFENYILDPLKFFNYINEIKISEERATKIVNNLTKILERYVFLDILKNPPEPKEDYYNKVDLINELKKINLKNQYFYQFYRELRLIIGSCQDLHLSLYLNDDIEDNYVFTNSLFISPIILKIENKKIFSIQNNLDIADRILNLNETKAIKYINGLDPFEYIQTFNKKFMQYKSPQAQFVFNLHYINNPFNLNLFPFSYSDISNIIIEYEDGSNINFNYKILYIDEWNNKLGITYNYYYDKIKHFFYDNFNFLDEWDLILEGGKLKCRNDDDNKVNVIYQETFHIDIDKTIEFLDECFSKFDNNIYPIIIIEKFNHGGYADLAHYLSSYINMNKSSALYYSYRYDDFIKNNISYLSYSKTIDTCKIKNDHYFFKPSKIKTFNYGNKIKHKTSGFFQISLIDETKFYYFRKKAKYIRKPHEIIIFTDGLSYSATSVFIKETQLNGGGIIVGYDGNPFFKNFDASLSPSPVFSTDQMLEDPSSNELEKEGFSLSYTIMESFSRFDYYDRRENIFPLEYRIQEIDERVELYNGYDDSKYQDFINEAKKIFEKYKTQCNPKNKNLLLISEKCIFSDYRLHGGYQCGNDGIWSNICVPSYCDAGFIFDKKLNKCIENPCINEEKYYIILRKNFSSLNFIIAILSVLLILFLILIFYEKNKKKKKCFIFIEIAILIMLIFMTFLY